MHSDKKRKTDNVRMLPSSCDRPLSLCLSSDSFPIDPDQAWDIKEGQAPVYATGQLIPVDKDTVAGGIVRDLFHQTMGCWSKIIKVEAICNPARCVAYSMKRLEYQSMLKDRFVEKYLWHGTSEATIKAIQNQGFDRMYQKVSAYGKGTYFALNASYACHFAKPDAYGLRRMILARVLIGEYCEGERDALPRDKPGQKHVPHESTVNNVDHPQIVAVYKDDQAFAEFVVTFRARSFPCLHPPVTIPKQPVKKRSREAERVVIVVDSDVSSSSSSSISSPPPSSPPVVFIPILSPPTPALPSLSDASAPCPSSSLPDMSVPNPDGKIIQLVVQMLDTLYGIKFWEDWPLMYLAKGISKRRPISTQGASGLQLLKNQATLDLTQTPRAVGLQNHDFLVVQFV